MMASTQIRLKTQGQDGSLSASKLEDFFTSAVSGLFVHVNDGSIRLNGVTYTVNGATPSLDDDSTTYIEVDTTGSGNLVYNTSAFTPGFWSVAQVVTSGGQVSSIQDKRGFIVGSISTPPVQVDGERPSGTKNGINKTFTLDSDIVFTTEHVYLNGIRQTRNVDADQEVSFGFEDSGYGIGGAAYNSTSDDQSLFQTLSFSRDGNWNKLVLRVRTSLSYGSLTEGGHIEFRDTTGGQPGSTLLFEYDFTNSQLVGIDLGFEPDHYLFITIDPTIPVTQDTLYCFVITPLTTNSHNNYGAANNHYDRGTLWYDGTGTNQPRMDQEPGDLVFQAYLDGGDGGDYTIDPGLLNTIMFNEAPESSDTILVDYKREA